MKIYNKSPYAQTIDLVGDSGDMESLTLQPHGTVVIPEGFNLAKSYSVIEVLDREE